MTVFEHAMMGASLALATGLQGRHGWRMVVLAGAAATLPDWDGLTIVLGPQAYARGHRVWGHNLLTASIAGLLAGVFEYRWAPLVRLVQAAARKMRARTMPALPSAGGAPDPSPLERDGAPALCMALGLVGALSHLFADYFYSGYVAEWSWALQLFWPFSHRGWAHPVVPGGNLGTTILFVVEMFALYLRPRRATLIAWVSLAAWSIHLAWWYRAVG